VVPGSADLAFLIPRNLFENELGPFAKELFFINQLIRDFSEATAGTPESVQSEELSSSVPTVVLAASGPVIFVIAKVVNSFFGCMEENRGDQRDKGSAKEDRYERRCPGTAKR